MFGLGGGELIIVAVVLVLLFGSKTVPELARGIRDVIRFVRTSFSDENMK